MRESIQETLEMRRGPWTLEEDTLLIHYIACHGEGRWNLLARCSGLKRTGKSCRLRWLNYLKPDVKRGNLSPQEQLLILELHFKWGNKWSRISQHLPGRTDNEIKNYWRTRVQRQARQLKIDVDSTAFRDAVCRYWRPRLASPLLPSTQTAVAAEQALPDQLPFSSWIHSDQPITRVDKIDGRGLSAGDVSSSSAWIRGCWGGNNCMDNITDSLWSMVQGYMISGQDGESL